MSYKFTTGLIIHFLMTLSLISFISSSDFSYDSPTIPSIVPDTKNTFLSLKDTPNSYSGQAGKCVQVGAGENALAFGSCGNVTAGNASSFNATYDAYYLANYTNKSNYWDNYNTANSTQMENSGGILNILESWIKSLFTNPFNQFLNTTSNVTFNNITANSLSLTNNLTFGIGTMLVGNNFPAFCNAPNPRACLFFNGSGTGSYQFRSTAGITQFDIGVTTGNAVATFNVSGKSGLFGCMNETWVLDYTTEKQALAVGGYYPYMVTPTSSSHGAIIPYDVLLTQIIGKSSVKGDCTDNNGKNMKIYRNLTAGGSISNIYNISFGGGNKNISNVNINLTKEDMLMLSSDAYTCASGQPMQDVIIQFRGEKRC